MAKMPAAANRFWPGMGAERGLRRRRHRATGHLMSDPEPEAPLTAAVEAGGTKFLCAVGTSPDDLRAECRIPTTTPQETLHRVAEFFEGWKGEPIRALGIATFGPAGVRAGRADHGFITQTPKAGWASTDLLGSLASVLPVPAGFDTDVNGAALGEWLWGAGRGSDSVLYVTVGTGIGGGLCRQGEPLHGLSHPEMGHVQVCRPEGERREFAGICPYHGDCLEGIASGPALAARWQCPAEELPDDHPAWDLWARDMGRGLCQMICTLSPEVIILGGGVASRQALLPRVEAAVRAQINGYVPLPKIVPPGLGGRSGLMGALALGRRAFAAAPPA